MDKVFLLDGSFATQISTHVGKSPDGDPLWTARFILTDTKAIHDTHLDYLRAGADIIETPTYQGSIDGFKIHFGLNDDQCRDPFYTATELAKKSIDTYKEEIGNERRVVNEKPLIAGSCGPYGAALHDGSEYKGTYDENLTKEFLIDWHRPRVEALLKGNVDLLAFETIPCEKEALAIVELIKEYPAAKAWLSFSCDKDGASLVNGGNFRNIATRCYNNGNGQIVAVGVNCLSPRIVTSLLKDINSDDCDEKIPLVAYPNSGEIYSEEAGWKVDETQLPIGLENYVHEWLDLGVRYIGGCCRTGAKEIAKIRTQIDLWHLHEKETAV